ncbi:MAG: hypothetical protein F6K19_14480 [Cyanothece sp. SIO1E1]|nr:hypothetical protein [Cyanothece sp. SIO1E1]
MSVVLYRAIAFGISVALLGVNLPARSETCYDLPLVGGEGSEVAKSVSPPGIPGPFGIRAFRDNWNTDWVVISGKKFKRFVATLASEGGGSFDINLFLKYSDETNDEFYDENDHRLEAGESLAIEATPRINRQPYQVNLRVGGLDNIGNSYTASVVACE